MSVDRLIEAARTFGDRISAQRREFAELASGQRPTTLFISCSDSRVVPVLITDARPGELFELRTAGAIVPAYSAESPCGVSATIEFALEEIGVRHIVVCGHSHCSAVRALVSSPSGTPGPAVERWLRQPHLRISKSGDGDPSLRGPVEEHVLAQLTSLGAHPHVQALTDSGELAVHGWYYEVHTGAVSVYDEPRAAFRPI
jgi:carbonic anhydrase